MEVSDCVRTANAACRVRPIRSILSINYSNLDGGWSLLGPCDARRFAAWTFFLEAVSRESVIPKNLLFIDLVIRSGLRGDTSKDVQKGSTS